MGAATAMANCRSGCFTLSFWSLNIRVNAPSKDMIPDKKQLCSSYKYVSVRVEEAYGTKSPGNLGWEEGYEENRFPQPLLGRECLTTKTEDPKPKTERHEKDRVFNLYLTIGSSVLGLRSSVFGLCFVDTHMVGAGYNHLLSLRALNLALQS